MRPIVVVMLLVAILPLACGPAGGKRSGTAAKARDPRKFSEEAGVLAKVRSTAIDEELKQLGEGHPWAGQYYVGDGLGVSVSLWLTPRSGFLFTWHGCLGLYDRNYGQVVSGDGLLRLNCELENNREGFQGIDTEFQVVSWGERRYLIPPREMISFCNAVNSGSEPRRMIYGQFALRRGDEAKKAVGRPSLPPECSSWVLSQPIQAIVSEIGSSGYRTGGGGIRWRVTPVTLNVGKVEGVFVGMELSGVEIESGFASVKVVAVEEHTSKAVCEQFEGNDPPPKSGWKLTTRRFAVE